MLSAKEILATMSSDFGMLPKHLQSIIRTAPIRYKVFYITKRSGGLREVAQPAREVKAIQRWLMERINLLLPIHEAATAYRIGKSIKDNALPHVGSNYMLKMDFRNFFPSILMDDIVRHLELTCGQQYDNSAIKLIAYVCTWAPKRQKPLRLCIGAPSSPMLSNSIMFDFDNFLAEKCKADGVVYTRYADDITLSAAAKDTLTRYPTIIQDIVESLTYPRLSINNKKTVFASRAGRRTVTGVSLTSDHRISIGREKKRQIRAMYHRMTLGQLNAEQIQELKGLISFAEHIEPGFSAWLTKND